GRSLSWASDADIFCLSARPGATFSIAVNIFADRQKMSAFEAQLSDRPPHKDDALFDPISGDISVHGSYPGRVRGRSLYTKAALHPVAALAGVAALGVGIAVAIRGRNN
ncbi:MAG TPA: hypothetical protein VFD22_00210, partial [Gemmatimonadaceae bacterium]|nr:hypothetical protein [Gemmatimonadaceae bacterium]